VKKTGLLMFCCATICLFATRQTQAAYSCTITGTQLTPIFSGALLNTSGTLSLTCTRASTDAATTTYSVNIDNGQSGARTVTRQGGSTTINYLIYRNSGYSQTWNQTTANNVDGTLSFGSGLTTSVTLTYYLRLAAQAGKPAGIYQDNLIGLSVNIPQNTTTVVGSGTMALSVSVLSECRFMTAPAAITLAYTSFRPTALSAGTTYTLLCTNSTPYTMALDATSSTGLGLNYTLSLSAGSGTGTGLNQTFNINATMPANQAGTCNTSSCNVSQARVLTITY
jgi:spore coat protein U-like protein